MGFEDWLYGLDGQPIDEATWHELNNMGLDVVGVGRDAIGSFLVSTVWIGLSMADPPLIYETAVFDGNSKVTEMYRWQDRQTAEREHQRIVEQLRRDYGNVTNGKNTDEH